MACNKLILSNPGADPGFQVRGAHLKKLHRAEGGANIFGVFRVKNHDFVPKKPIFFPILGEGGSPLKPSHAVTSIKQSPVLKGLIFLVLS